MSNKTGILAVAITAMMLVCALSGAVYFANTSSNNNGGANVDTSVIDSDRASSNFIKNDDNNRVSEVRIVQEAPKVVEEVREAEVAPGAAVADTFALPADAESFYNMMEELESTEMTVFEVLQEKYYFVEDDKVTIDSTMAASNYLYGLGYFVIGDSLYGEVIESTPDDQTKLAMLEQDIVKVNEELKANKIDEETAQKRIVDIKSKIESIKKAMEAQKASETFGASADHISDAYRFNSITELTVAGFAAGSWATNSAVELARIAEENDDINEKELAKIAIEIADHNKSLFTDYLATLDDETLYEGSLLTALYGTPFSVNGDISNVKDVSSLTMYLYSNLGYAMVGTSMVTYIDEARFIDATEVSPLAVMNLHFLMTMETTNMQRDYAIHFVSNYFNNGPMSMDECIYRSDKLTALYEEYYKNNDVAPKNKLSIECLDVESSFVPAYLEFLGTPFCYDGVYMTVTDMSSFEKYCASLYMAAGSGYIHVIMNGSSKITKIAIDQIDDEMMFDILTMDFCVPYVFEEYEFPSIDADILCLNVPKGMVLGEVLNK